MIRYICKRLLEAIPVLLIVATLTFFLTRIAPGGPFDQERNLPPEIEKQLNQYYGFDQSLYKQYFDYLSKLIRGDLGPSFKYSGWTVNEIIAGALPVSAELGAYALLVAVGVGVSAGMCAALFPNRFGDHLPMAFAMMGICLPTFVLGPLLILVFSLTLGWFNASGWIYPEDRVLPALTLGFYYAAYIARLTRGGILEMMTQDFIRTARAKGAGEFRVLVCHAARGGLVPVISFMGPAMAGLVTGSFVVETIFQIPGLGQYFVNAAFNRDYTMVLGTVLFYATFIVFFNLVVDLVLVWLNPAESFESKPAAL
ncbi:MAG TPA: ABC transporter permease subunit [Verrucomicrobiales bacterium]|nr:ABC transporter permease subunit [Verrucomicrobiales bacterium]